MKILMVCLGNICRSPLAKGIMKSKLPENYKVDSAGTIAFHQGKHPDPRSISTAASHGIDISSQRSRLITSKDLEYFDRIFCMDLKNYEDVVSMTKSETERKKVSLLLEEAGHYGDNVEVPDPYYGTITDFQRVYFLLDDACEKVAEKLIK